MPLRGLLRKAGLSTLGAAGTVSGVEHDSRRVRRGQIFCALPSASGKATDAAAYAIQAADAGACAVVATPAALRKAVLGKGIVGLPCADVRGAYGRLCAAFHGFPARHLALTGITGTNGKTTTAFLLRGLLDPGGLRSVLVGTIGYWVGRRFHDAPNTTPSALELQALFA